MQYDILFASFVFNSFNESQKQSENMWER